jgi:hypothetical protein
MKLFVGTALRAFHFVGSWSWVVRSLLWLKLETSRTVSNLSYGIYRRQASCHVQCFSFPRLLSNMMTNVPTEPNARKLPKRHTE